LRGALGQRGPRVAARGHRRVAAVRRAHRRAAAGPAHAEASGVPAAVDSIAERGIWLAPESGTAPRRALAAFVDHALRLDDAAVVRLRTRSDGLLTAWVATGFDVLASRAVAGRIRPDDLSV